MKICMCSIFMALVCGLTLGVSPANADDTDDKIDPWIELGDVSITSITPVIADVDNDGFPEVLFGTAHGKLYSIKSDGTYTIFYDGCLQDEIIETSVTVADLDADGIVEVLFGTNGGYLYCIHDGNGDGIADERWYFRADGAIKSSPVAVDLNDDAEDGMEVLFGSEDDNFYCLDSNGVELWRIITGDDITWSSSAIADVDGDGKLEIIFGSKDKHLYCVKSDGSFDNIADVQGEDCTDGWKYNVDKWVVTPPVIADLDGDGILEILFMGDKYLYCINNEHGATGSGYKWRYECSYAAEWPPAVADLNGDGFCEILINYWKYDTSITKYKQGLFCLGHDGNERWHCPTEASNYNPIHSMSSPAVADLDNDGILEILFLSHGSFLGGLGGYDAYLYCLNVNDAGDDYSYKWGESKPVNTSDRSMDSSPVVGDLDDDGNLEVVFYVCGNRELFCVDKDGKEFVYSASKTQTTPNPMPWPMFGQNLRHTSCYPYFDIAITPLITDSNIDVIDVSVYKNNIVYKYYDSENNEHGIHLQNTATGTEEVVFESDGYSDEGVTDVYEEGATTTVVWYDGGVISTWRRNSDEATVKTKVDISGCFTTYPSRPSISGNCVVWAELTGHPGKIVIYGLKEEKKIAEIEPEEPDEGRDYSDSCMTNTVIYGNDVTGYTIAWIEAYEYMPPDFDWHYVGYLYVCFMDALSGNLSEKTKVAEIIGRSQVWPSAENLALYKDKIVWRSLESDEEMEYPDFPTNFGHKLCFATITDNDGVPEVSDEIKVYTNQGYNIYQPAIFENNIVWLDVIGDEGNARDIYMYSIKEREGVNITKDLTGNHTHPDIFGNKIVWLTNEDSHDRDLYMATLLGVGTPSCPLKGGDSSALPAFSDVVQFGALNINHNWQQVAFAESYTNAPVVIAKCLSYVGSQPAHVRIKDVTEEGFKARIEEWAYEDGGHMEETIGYIAIPEGNYTFNNGNAGNLKIEAGKISKVKNNWKTIEFKEPFLSEPPIVLTQAQNYYSGRPDPIVTRNRNISNGSFEVRVQEEEVKGRHGYETVGYIAITPFAGNIDGIEIDAAIGRGPSGYVRGITHAAKTMVFNESFSDTPVFIADMQTCNGNDTAGLRYTLLTVGSATIFVEEEQSKDPEIVHYKKERVGYITMHRYQP